MARSWVSFVHDLDPNGHGLENAVKWPVYDAANPKNIVFRADDNDKGTFVEQDVWRKDQLEWWNQHWSSLRS